MTAVNGSPTEGIGLRERKKRAAQRAIRSAALQLFGEQGYDCVTIDQIAAAAGVSRTTFFNYFPQKESVVLQPDRDEIDAWQRLREKRPEGESTWDSITALVLDSLQQGRDWLLALKHLRTSSSGAGFSPLSESGRLTSDLWSWLEQRTPSRQHALARLQLNTALAAVVTAFDEWQLHRGFPAFLKSVRHNLDQLGRGFSTD